MIVLYWPLKCAPLPPTKFGGAISESLNLSPNATLNSSIFQSQISTKASFKCCCIKDRNTQEPSEGFSVLPSDVPWARESIWSNFALYLFSLHVPLSFGGLSVVAQIMHQPVLDLQIEALSLLVIQSLELIVTLPLLKCMATPQFKLVSLFGSNKLSKKRNWLLSSALGLGLLIFLVFLTSILADRVIGPKTVNNPILKDILSSSNTSFIACVFANCVVTPLLEETVYRGFLLTSLTSTMKWQMAVAVSSAVFSAAHFSGENFLQLFIVGCVLGYSYCWSGNLCSSIVIHSFYNAATLLVTFLS